MANNNDGDDGCIMQDRNALLVSMGSVSESHSCVDNESIWILFIGDDSDPPPTTYKESVDAVKHAAEATFMGIATFDQPEVNVFVAMTWMDHKYCHHMDGS
eukprot:175435_1